MKKHFILILAVILSACSNYLAEDEELDPDLSAENTVPIPMTVKVRSAPEESINYPVQVFVFDKTGKEVNHSEITKEKQSLNIELSAGSYELAAFTGLDSKSYQIPEHPTLEDIIKTEECKPCSTPLQFGKASFDLQKKLNLSIHLNYIVSSLEFAFSDVPTDAAKVEIGISPTSASYSMNGEYSNDKFMCKASCKKKEDKWIAGPLYVLPSNQSHITLTLFVERPSGIESLSYTYASDFDAAQPYRFNGKYNGGISLGGTFEVTGWKPNINVDFDFSDEGNNGNEGNSEGEDNKPANPDNPSPSHPSSSIIYCNTLPQAGEFYEDHFVWKSDLVSENETHAVLLSKQQWFNILAVDGPNYIKDFTELDLGEWRVFTKDEAKEFNAQFDGKMAELNGQLSQHNQDEFYFYNKERYLCDNCKSTFSVSGSNRITAAGSKKTYYMRAIKEITFKVK